MSSFREKTAGSIFICLPSCTAGGKHSERTYMQQSPMLAFTSSKFAIEHGEDEKTNPGVYGKSLSNWLSDQLRSADIKTGEVIAEDFGWCVPVESKPHIYAVCASSGSAPNDWRVFAFAESGLLARLMGKNRNTEPLAKLFAAVRRVLTSSPMIQSLRELES